MTADPSPAAGKIANLLAHTTRLQSSAADPKASVWVSANAGTGKTHVLTQRVLRLLMAGTAPERILCLTYTKAAAAEMSKRVFDTLAAWVGLTDTRLEATLAPLLERKPSQWELQLARTLFTRAIETPGGLKVQTIHAYCERLLQRFPLEAGIAPGFKILDDATRAELIGDATDAMLRDATAAPRSDIGRALCLAIRYAAESQFDQVLGEGITKRALLDALVRGDRGTSQTGAFDIAEAALRRAFQVRPASTAASISAEMDGVLAPAMLTRLRDALAASSPADAKLALHLSAALATCGPSRRDHAANFFLTAAGGPRVSLMTARIRKAHPDLESQAEAAQARFAALKNERAGLDVTEATLALYHLAGAVLQRYSEAKSARAALDFDDLITTTGRLLQRSEDAAWVLYKLDGGLDHILVDEAQDTAPPQWLVIESLAEQFFDPAGAKAGATPRTVFAVGDEKQSIYSFQGAAPEMFAAKGAAFQALAQAAGQTFRPAALTLSFRSTQPILNAVDRVFADPAAAPGLLNDAASPIQHAVKRLGQGGLVELWPVEAAEDIPEADAWLPLEEATPSSPVTRLANRIAATIRGWLETKDMLASAGRPVEAGDILILVRKRAPFAPAIVAALKNAGVRVAGADRIELARQIAVQDLLALGDFLTLPEDDLALAAVLKSPLFNLDDDDLLALAPARKRTLWRALLDAALVTPRYGEAAALLKRWRKEADFKPPFEFFASVLDHDRGRARLLNRLGPDAADGIDAFLNLALTYDDGAPPSLTGFLASVRASVHTIKRDMEQGRDEVRVLTVHGAKGLEAPIVFLPDTCSVKSGRTPSGLLTLHGLDLPSATPDLVAWPVKGSSCLPAIQAARAALAVREREELNRLLYVALTRPRDRLYIAGVQSRKALPAGCWYDTIATALKPDLAPVTLPDGSTVYRLIAPHVAKPDGEASGRGHAVSPAAAPPWAHAPAPREAAPAIPIAPSRLAPYDFDDDGEPSAHPPSPHTVAVSHDTREPANPPPSPGGADRFLRGTLTHALLQHLPSLEPTGRRQAATRFISARGAALPASVRKSIVAETLAVLDTATFAALFATGSAAEVPIAAELQNPRGKGPPLHLTGQIDRLAVTASEVLIVDYKTNRNAPASVAGVAHVYVAQLAAYRLALAAIYPDKTIRAALLWTQLPLLMEIPAAALDAAEATLWAHGTPQLDAGGLPS